MMPLVAPFVHKRECFPLKEYESQSLNPISKVELSHKELIQSTITLSELEFQFLATNRHYNIFFSSAPQNWYLL